MNKGSLMIRHGLEAKTFLLFVRSKDAEFALLGLRPFCAFCKHGKGWSRIRDVVILVRVRIDIQCQSQFAVSLETRAFVITFESLGRIAFARLRGVALNLLLEMLTGAGDEHLALARLVLSAY